MQLDAAIIRQENTLKCFIMKLRFNNLCHRKGNHVNYDEWPNKFNSKKEIFFENWLLMSIKHQLMGLPTTLEKISQKKVWRRIQAIPFNLTFNAEEHSLC